VCSGFKDVPGFQKCAFLCGLRSHSYRVGYNLIPWVTAMTLLHIDSSVLGPHSVSRQVSAAIVDRLVQTMPSLDIIYRDLIATPLSHLSGSHLAAAHGNVPTDPAMQQDLADSQAVLDEFLRADIIVLGAPMYNFTIPSQLKAWIDRILVPGKTFKYGAQGPEGLAGNKRVIVAISRGGFYGPGTPAAALEHLETYLRGVFGFIGVTRLEFISADGIQVGPEYREKALESALQAATRLRAA
jgi:FMN-dependent NADH-azoreductase